MEIKPIERTMECRMDSRLRGNFEYTLLKKPRERNRLFEKCLKDAFEAEKEQSVEKQEKFNLIVEKYKNIDFASKQIADLARAKKAYSNLSELPTP